MSYAVLVDDNFHYMEEEERYKLGEFATYDEALAACRRIVDDFLAEHHKPGMIAGELYQHYVTFGEDPWIDQDAGDSRFSASKYAGVRCHALCGGDTAGTQ